MRIANADLYLSMGPAPNAAGHFHSEDDFTFSLLPPAVVEAALTATFGAPRDGQWLWERGDEWVCIGPIDITDGHSEDDSDAFMQAWLEVDVEVSALAQLLERVRAQAPPLWIGVSGSDDFYLPSAFAAGLEQGSITLA